MSSPKLVVIDDTDSRIQYSDGWFQDHGSTDNALTPAGTFGVTYQHTSHGTNTNASFSFPFQGTAVYMTGRVDIVKINDGTQNEPGWSCFVDGQSISSFAPYYVPLNNVQSCTGENLPDGPHTLTVNVTSHGRTFWVDSLLYTPSASETLDSPIFKVGVNDSAITYSGSGDWNILQGQSEGTVIGTQVAGATMNYTWTGTNLTWVSTIPDDLPKDTTTGSYSIDGGDPVTFSLIGLPPAGLTKRNEVFFSTPEIKPGRHSISVTYHGDSNHTPLSLAYLYVNGATTSSNGTTTGSTTTPSTDPGNPSTSPSPASSGSNKPPLGAILGASLGGAAFILLAIIAFILLRRRRTSTLKSTSQSLRPNYSSLPTSQIDPPPFSASPFPSDLRQTPGFSKTNPRPDYQYENSSSSGSGHGGTQPYSKENLNTVNRNWQPAGASVDAFQPYSKEDLVGRNWQPAGASVDAFQPLRKGNDWVSR